MTKIINLYELLEAQADLQHAMGNPIPDNEAGAIQHLHAAHVELVEVLNELNWKPWKKTRKVVDRDRLATELVDVLQFWANVANCLNISALELSAALRAKWEVNHQRVRDGY